MQYTKDKIMATDVEKRVAKNKALANSAKGKTQTPTAEAARRAANKEVTGKSVKVVPPTSNTSRADRNHQATLNASRAKSGNTAKQGAFFVDEFNSSMRDTSKPPVLRIRSTGGLGGGGGTLRNSIR